MGVAGLPLVLLLCLLGGVGYYMLRCDCYNSKGIAIISREGWGSSGMNDSTSEERGIYDEKTNPGGIYHYDLPLRGKFTTVVVHHSALPARHGAKYIQELHIRERSFADIGYHFIIDRRGRVFEGRDRGIRGAHVKGHNSGKIGVVLLGDFQETDPSLCQKNALVKFLVYMNRAYSVKEVAAHIHYNPEGTVCPGNKLLKIMDQVAEQSAMKYVREVRVVN